MSSTGGASQFTDTNCLGYDTYGYAPVDIQLAKDVFTGLGSDPFVYECQNIRYTGPSSFPDCGNYSYFTTFCIGAHNQQHACAVGPNCHSVDWSGVHAPACSTAIMQFASVQTAGLNTPCCKAEYCSKAGSNASNPGSMPQLTCPDADLQLWLCVNSGSSVECVNPQDQSICSGNFTTSGSTGGEHSGVASTSTNIPYSTWTGLISPTLPSTTSLSPAPSSASNQQTGGLPSGTKIIIIAVGVCAGVVCAAILFYFLFMKKDRKGGSATINFDGKITAGRDVFIGSHLDGPIPRHWPR